MIGGIGAHDMDRIIAETTALQRRAADPAASAWVAANAGTGKTHVLTQRVLRLLLSGTPPSRILCLTYTKAAAAEMSKRVFDTLASWIGMPQAELSVALEALSGRRPEPRTLSVARTLFTAAIETPGGFKVQTIHAFAERLLQRFPLEAGVPPAFTILEDMAARALMREATDAVLREASHDVPGKEASPLQQALHRAVRYAADETFDHVLADAIADKALIDHLQASADVDVAFERLERTLRVTFSAPADANTEDIENELADVLDDPTLQRVIGILGAGSTQEMKYAELLRLAIGSAPRTRIATLRSYFLTGDGGLRGRLLMKQTAEDHPDLEATLKRAQARFAEYHQIARALDVVTATIALYRLAHAVHKRFEALKAARAALDFDDLIVRTSALFTSRDRAAWVLYKLDGGIDHVLVDEAQDTSPEQWRIVGAIVEEFFGDTGAGSEQDGKPRTIFAVGDEKQSIYSFQGAAPEMFAASGARFEALARAGRRDWHGAALTLSWRTVTPVLDLVDATFAKPSRTPGLTADPASRINHRARRAGHAGLVEIWPLEEIEATTPTDAWSPLEETGSASPVVVLADRIAATIRNWLDNGETLPSENRLVRAGDILILVRKRQPVAPAIVAALKRAGIPVAGADRVVLADQLAVQDLLALGDFLTLPEDDLALANVLKGPLFGFDDDDLLRIAPGRKGTLWKALLDAAEAKPDAATTGASPSARSDFQTAAEQLKQWRKQADFLPPFEFFANVLDRDGGRKKLLSRLGPEAADPLDEFLNLALVMDDEAPPSLTGFLGWLREDNRTIKRDMEQGRDEVRVLTVHGAKGLEAPIVFLPDTIGTPGNGGRGARLVRLSPMQLPAGHPPLSFWQVAGAKGLPAAERAREDMRAAEIEESNRLLYVAMTRPRDRLYICGARARKKADANSWYETITQALSDPAIAPRVETSAAHRQPGQDGPLRTIRSIRSPQLDPAMPPKRSARLQIAPAARPAWLSSLAPREIRPAIPFAPSRIAPYDHDASGEPIAWPGPRSQQSTPVADPPASPPPSPLLSSEGDARLVRGTLIHALLEHLPSLPREARAAAAHGFLSARGAALPSTVRKAMVDETLGLLNDPNFAPLFGPDSRAEVPIAAEIDDPTGRSPPLILNGQIDRLWVDASRVSIIDYKTNRNPPSRIEDVPEAYIVQIAAYRVALQRIFPGRETRSALLWTAIPKLMVIPDSLLDEYAKRLFELATRPLDLNGLAP